MTREEAIQAMSEGEKVTHRYFSKDEWCTMPDPHTIKFEDGCMIDPNTFWSDRQGESWNKDWEIWHGDFIPAGTNYESINECINTY